MGEGRRGERQKPCICYKQVKTTTFISHQTKLGRYFTIQTLRICNLQYVGKNETPFNIRLHNQRKDVKDPKAILADEHVQKWS